MYKSISALLVVAALGCVSLTVNAGSIPTNDLANNLDTKWRSNNDLGTLLDTLDIDDSIPCAKSACGGALTLPTPHKFVVETWPFGNKSFKAQRHNDDFLVWLNDTRLFDARAGSRFTLGDRSSGLPTIAWIHSLQIPSKDNGTNSSAPMGSDAVGSDIAPSTDSAVSVPEPGTIGLMGLALLGLAFARRRNRRQS